MCGFCALPAPRTSDSRGPGRPASPRMSQQGESRTYRQGAEHDLSAAGVCVGATPPVDSLPHGTIVLLEDKNANLSTETSQSQ